MKQGESVLSEQPFQQVLAELNGGNTMRELSKKMAQLVLAVEDTGKIGELTLKVKVRPATKGNGMTLLLEDNVSVKIPEADRAQTLFFSVGGGKLQRNDPRQQEIGSLRSVPVADDNNDLREAQS